MNTNVIEPIAAEGIGTVNQEGGITTSEKVYTFRKLNGKDTFLMFKILGKIGISEFTNCFNRESVKQMMSTAAGNASDVTQAVGISVILEIANVIVGNLPKCEQEIYQMLSQTSNLTVEQVKELDFVTFIEMVIDFVKKDEFKDFISVVSKLFKSGN